ncbi:guanylate kinase [Phenylobacterium sp. SCN 70-31]|uniref:guanylate kinase n=1 Tax=Phenylobacterium sp. SCN 70-31 TaxID=1660129 RepID=UPI00086A827E|nr:guanylate kinase [Phenylobacterium sp. SCN 70-31]ODT87946.1 MAG: guanylate kinase [Phenylobacterium sp. SCN 70-31]
MSPSDDHSKPWETTRRGLLLLVSSPAGAGKTSLTRTLVADYDSLILSISATTRAPRPGEEEGREYYFKTRAQFEAMIEAGDFLEWATVNGNYYGTPKAPVMAALEAGHDVIFDIDWQGAQQVAERAPTDAVRVFILPPAWGDLERRLRARAQDSEAVMDQRLRLGQEEIRHWDRYDYVIVNKNFDRAYADLQHIYRAERMKPVRNAWLPGFVGDLLAEAAGEHEATGAPPRTTMMRPVQK